MRRRSPPLCVSAALGFALASLALAGVRSWTSGGPGAFWIIALAVDPSAPRVVYAGTAGTSFGGDSGAAVYKSVNAGGSWLKTFAPADLPNVMVIAVDPTDSQSVYLGTGFCFPRTGTCGGSVYRSANGGASWTLPSSPGLVRALALDPRSVNTLFAEIQLSVGPSLHPYKGLRSVDRGESWEEIGGGFPSVSVNQFLFDPSDEGLVYLASDAGVFKSVDRGTTWNLFTNGLPSVRISSLALALSTLYAGTDAGLFKSMDGGATWVSTGFMNPVGWVTVNPRNSGNPFVATLFSGRVLESSDGGESWLDLSSGLPNYGIHDFVVDWPWVSLHVATGKGVFDYFLRPTLRVVPFR